MEKINGHHSSVRNRNFRWTPISLLFLFIIQAPASAGIFTLPQFLDPGESQIGVEPEFVFTHRGGPGIQGRFAYGVNDLSNLHIWSGTGSDPRGFRVGSLYSFDFIPDIEGQIGAGIAVGGQFLKHPQWNRWEVLAVPYVHEGFFSGNISSPNASRKARVVSAEKKIKRNGKSDAPAIDEETVEGESSEIREDAITEPYLAFPIGYSRINGEWEVSSTFVVGALFHSTPYLTYVMEFGMNVNFAETYLSGGIAFQF